MLSKPYWESHHYRDARKRCQRLDEQSKYKMQTISSVVVFDFLCSHFLNGRDKNRIVDDIVDIYKVKRGYAQRILSTKEGAETSRCQDVRRIFREMCKNIGLGDPFTDYVSKEEIAKKKRRPSLGVVK